MGKFFKIGCLGFIVIIGIIILFAIIGILAYDNTSTEVITEEGEPTTNETAPTSTEAEPAEEGVLTQEKFDQIKDEMSYEEVVKIIGSEGTLVSETGEKGTDLHTVMYEWTSADTALGNANFMFQGNKLRTKAQAGLGEGANSDVQITAEEFEKIQNGMSYEEVQQIVGGEGELTSETGAAGKQYHMIMITYYGDAIGSNAVLSFTENKLETKSQFGLE